MGKITKFNKSLKQNYNFANTVVGTINCLDKYHSLLTDNYNGITHNKIIFDLPKEITGIKTLTYDKTSKNKDIDYHTSLSKYQKIADYIYQKLIQLQISKIRKVVFYVMIKNTKMHL